MFSEKDVVSHLEVCVDVVVTCEGCGDRVKHSDIKDHKCHAPNVAPLMQLSMYQCPYCEEADISGSDGLEAHMAVCENACAFAKR